MDAGIYTWMATDIYGWMLWQPDRGIYTQMLGPSCDRVQARPGCPGWPRRHDRHTNSHPFRSGLTCSRPA
jgi:hypothetical protein